MRALFISLLLFATGCRCLASVDELDGGEGGGAGGASGGAGGASGGSAGGAPSDGGCSSASQCTGPRPATSLCSFAQMDAGFSCIDGACVFDCRPDRTCTSWAGDGGCLTCGTGRSCSDRCNYNMVANLGPDNGCPSVLSSPLSLAPLSGTCGWIVSDASGRTLGTVYRLDDFTQLLYLPGLGGTCTGFNLSSQVERWLVSCPVCQFELGL